MQNTLTFKGRKAVVIGGTKDAGLEITLRLILSGAEVHSFGRNVEINLEENREDNLKKSIENKKLHFHKVDFEKTGMSILENEEFSSILMEADILVVCFGPFVYKPLQETTAEDWQRMAVYDYAFPGALTSVVLPSMMAKKWGRILLFGGTRTESVRGYKMNAAYAGAKTGISVLVKSVAAVSEGYGITCNAVLPGFARNPPSPQYLVGWDFLADQAIHLLENPCLNGVLLNADKGWSPS